MNGPIISSSLAKQSNPEEHNFFISEVNKAIKDVQHLAASTSCGVRISNDHWQLQRLTERLDHLFLYGLKSYLKGYFEAFREFTHHSIVDEISHLKNIHTNIGKSRAWLLHALRDHLLGSYFQCTVSKSKHLSKFYDRRSLFFDEPRLELLITLASGLENIEFELHLDIDHLDLYCYGGNSMNFRLNNESLFLIPKNDPSNVEDCISPRLEVLSTSSGIKSAPPDARDEDGSISKDREPLVVEHMPRKKKKVHKNKETDDTSLSSDSSNMLPSDIPSHASANAFDGRADIPTSAKDVEVGFEGNDVFKDVGRSKKSAESLLFDELFEKVVFGKIAQSDANNDLNPASEEEIELNSRAPTTEKESFNVLDDGRHREDVSDVICDDEQRVALSELSEPETKRISETDLADETSQRCRAFEEDLQVDNVCDETSTTERLEATTVLKEDEGNDDVANIMENVDDVEENVQESSVAPQFDSPPADLEKPPEFKVSNNLKVVLFLDIFKDEDEIFLKAFQTFQNFMEGKPMPLLTIITSHSLYFIISCLGKLKLHHYVSYKDLSFLSIGLDEQSLDFVEKNKRRYSICTCNPHLTRTLVDEISRAVSEHFIGGKLLILGEATNQRISIKRWVSSVNPKLKATSAIIRGFFLIAYSTHMLENTKMENKNIAKRGPLHVLTLAQHMYGISPMWRKGWFVLRNDSLHEFTDDSSMTEVSTFRLSEWQDSKKCSKSSSGRKHCFSLVPSSFHQVSNQANKQKSKSSISQLFQTSHLSPINSGSRCNKALPSLTFSARTSEDAKEWIDSLKSVIRNSWKNDRTRKIRHGCCILIGVHVHLCSMNSITCEISNHVSFPLSDLLCVIQSCKRSIKLSFNPVGIKREGLEEEDRQFDVSNMDFEVVEFGDVMDDVDSVQERRSSAVEMSPLKSSKENAGSSSKLTLIFQSTDDLRRFCSEIKSMFLNATGKELQVMHDDGNAVEEIAQNLNFYDWNSLDGVLASTP